MKFNKKIKLILFFLLFINIGFYTSERFNWVNDKHEYLNAKKWLVPANMMLVYGTAITSLPLIDERSFIMKPIISMQDYFVTKWKENLPNDDSEKYLDWYIFRLNTYLLNNTNNVILYKEDIYSLDEVRTFLDKAWFTIENIVKYEAKDKEFNKIRYAAFLKVSFVYISNVTIYWAKINLYDKKYIANMFEKKDAYIQKRYYKLYDYINTMNNYYKTNYNDIFERLNNKYYKATLNYNLTSFILRDILFNNTDICTKLKNNKYINTHNEAKEELKQMKKDGFELSSTIEFNFKNSVDDELNKKCNNIIIKDN